MPYSDTFIIIHLVKNIANVSMDDTIHIVKNLDDSVFELTFKDNDEHFTHKVYQMTRDNICDYVYFLLKNLSLDEDGYQNIQLSLPAMPRVLVNASKLHDNDYREHFLELIENSLDMFDKVEKLTIKKPVEKKSACPNCRTCVMHTSAGCCEVKMNCRNSWPDLPNSPVHTYFQ